jgi:hypothetical protein
MTERRLLRAAWSAAAVLIGLGILAQPAWAEVWALPIGLLLALALYLERNVGFPLPRWYRRRLQSHLFRDHRAVLAGAFPGANDKELTQALRETFHEVARRAKAMPKPNDFDPDAHVPWSWAHDGLPRVSAALSALTDEAPGNEMKTLYLAMDEYSWGP